MQIALFKDSRESFIQVLSSADLTYQEHLPKPGQVTASGALITVAQTAAIAGSIAAVLVAWIRGRASRKVILTLHDRTIVHLEGYSVDQVEELLPLVDHCAVFDTEMPTEKPT